MSDWSNEYILNHSWKRVAVSLLHKYPNKYNTNLLTSDTVDQWIDSHHRIHIIRHVTVNFNVPWIVTTVFDVDSPQHVLEYIVIDRDNQKYQYYSGNISMGSFMSAREFISYTQSPTDPHQTIMHQGCNLELNHIPLAGFIVEFFKSSFTNNSYKGINTISYKIKQIDLHAEALHFIKPLHKIDFNSLFHYPMINHQTACQFPKLKLTTNFNKPDS